MGGLGLLWPAAARADVGVDVLPIRVGIIAREHVVVEVERARGAVAWKNPPADRNAIWSYFLSRGTFVPGIASRPRGR